MISGQIERPFTTYDVLRFHYRISQVHEDCDRIPYMNTNMRIATIEFPEKPMFMFELVNEGKLVYSDGTDVPSIGVKKYDDRDVIVYKVSYYDMIPELTVKIIDDSGEELDFWSHVIRWGYLLDDDKPLIAVNMFLMMNKYLKLPTADNVISNQRRISYLPFSLLKMYTRVAIKWKCKSCCIPYVTIRNRFRNIEVDPISGPHSVIISVPEEIVLYDTKDNIISPANKENLPDLPDIPGYKNKYVIPYWDFMRIIECPRTCYAYNTLTDKKSKIPYVMYPEALMRFKSRIGELYRWLYIRLDI